MWPRTIIAAEKKPQSPKNSRLFLHPHTGGLQTRHCNSHSSQLSTHVAATSWKLLKLSPRAQICPWQRCCFPGSALEIQPSSFPPSTLQISDDLEQRASAVMITKPPKQEDEQEWKAGRAALALHKHWGTRWQQLHHRLVTQALLPGTRGCQELLCQPGRHRSRLSLLTSDTGAPTQENTRAEHACLGPVEPQDRFLLQLFTY